MNRSFRIILFLLFVSFQLCAFAQNNVFDNKSWELNFTGSLGSLSSSQEISGTYYNGSSDESYKYLQLGVIPAYYIYKGLAIEPELNIFTIEKMKPTYLVIGNLSYTFAIENSNIFPFIRAGYGLSNGIQFPVNEGVTRLSNKFDIGILNLGGGIKILMSKSFLFRAELNYRMFNQTDDTYPGFKVTNKFTSVAMLFGFSVLL